MTNRELMQQLHDELVDSLKGGIIPFETGQIIKKRREKLIEELRARLAQPEPLAEFIAKQAPLRVQIPNELLWDAYAKDEAQPEPRTGDCLLTGVCAAEGHRIQKAQPEPEPVAWMRHKTAVSQGWDELSFERAFDDDVPLYTAPPRKEWQGLTDEEIKDAGHLTVEEERMLPYSFARAIEAKLKEKNSA